MRNRKLLMIAIAAVLIAMLFGLAACEYVIYDPENEDDVTIIDKVGSDSTPEVVERFLYVEAYGGRPNGLAAEAEVPAKYSVTEGSNFSKLLKYVKNGFDFAGWYIDTEYNTLLTSYIMPGRDLYVYAKWTPQPAGPDTPVVPDETEVTISFNVKTANGITDRAEIASIKGKPGEPMTLPIPSHDGFKFDGWYYSGSLNERVDAAAVFPEYNATFHAKWVKETFLVRFYLYSKDSKDIYFEGKSHNYSEGDSISDPGVPIRSGYRFISWYTLSGDSAHEVKETVDFNTFKVGTENVTIYAEWEAREYTITFVNAYGEAPQQITAKVDTDITALKPADPVRGGYTFLGWYINKELRPGDLAYDFKLMLPYDATLYAQWSLDDYIINISSGSGAVTGTLYPADDPLYEDVFTTVTLKAQAGEYTQFNEIKIAIAIEALAYRLLNADGTYAEPVILTDKTQIANLITITYDPVSITDENPVSIKIHFKLDAKAGVEFAGAEFGVMMKVNVLKIIDGNGNEVDANDIKPTVSVQ